jgi:hypothetical protein
VPVQEGIVGAVEKEVARVGGRRAGVLGRHRPRGHAGPVERQTAGQQRNEIAGQGETSPVRKESADRHPPKKNWQNRKLYGNDL